MPLVGVPQLGDPHPEVDSCQMVDLEERVVDRSEARSLAPSLSDLIPKD